QFTSGYNTAGLSITVAATPALSGVTVSDGGVTVTWKAATGAEKYRVYRRTSDSSWTKVGVTTSTSYTDTTAKAGTTYYYTVRCVNSANNQFTSGYNTTGLTAEVK
ncbi:MAG: fibronectin type III domain-containing protein, partial [Clostridiales bacterium]|nr:fibronectin type III domain-containing protein [Clostridiales bacterium]